MQLFYTPTINPAEEFTLPEQESKHCIRVLRMVEGDEISLTDGEGNLYKAQIIAAYPKACKLIIKKHISNYEQRPYYLHIAIAPTKNTDRFEWFLEKATEIGIDEITPLLTEHSERKQLKPERLERIIISAMKQSIKAYKPRINPLVDLNAFLKRGDNADFNAIAHCNQGAKDHIGDLYVKGQSSTILIGPEGDFSLIEIKNAISKGYKEISLGNSRLRTETAGIVAVHTISLLNT